MMEIDGVMIDTDETSTEICESCNEEYITDIGCPCGYEPDQGKQWKISRNYLMICLVMIIQRKSKHITMKD